MDRTVPTPGARTPLTVVSSTTYSGERQTMPRIAQDTHHDDRPAKYSVPALEKALDVIEHLSETAVPMTQSELSRALNRSASELFRILTALEMRGYLRRDAGGRYSLTLKLFELSRTHSPYDDLLEIALPAMRQLSEDVAETCHLTALRESDIVVLAQHESPNPIRLSVEVGSRHSPLSTTSGRILLSAMTDEERTAYLHDYTDFASRPLDVRETFLTRVRAVRERGHEISDGERFVGGLDIGVLLGSAKSRIRAALIVATLKRADGPNVDEILQRLKSTAGEIAARAGIA